VTPQLGALLSRAMEEPAEADGAEVEERILDAALEEVAAYGTARATMEGVGTRAGVSRITVFRRFGSKDALVERLMLRELERFLASVERTFASVSDPGDRVVEGFVACVRAGTEHPLVARLARVEPGLALERLHRGDPAPIDVGRAFVAHHLRAGLPARDPLAKRADAVADVLVRLAAAYVFFPGPLVDLRDKASVRAFARTALVPIAV
jgi:TetR/AcrR family transcriptional regulator, repressor for uid operon